MRHPPSEIGADPLAPSRLDELKKRYEENPRRFFAPLANEYRKAGDLDQAIALCQEHLQDQPGNMNGQVVYGQALFDAGRYDDAEATFQTALALARLDRPGTFRLAAVNRFGKAVVVDDTLIGQEGDTLVFVAATDALDELGAHIERGGEA